ncbi:MAG TPA: alpha/beta hydrolase [Desulfobacteraceae bacterium]|nr:alpha/beta hydrolase [Desulfobacteraceae bacterium]
MGDHLTVFHKGRPCRIDTQWYRCGSQGRPVLVFLHEGLGCIASWKDIPEQISRATNCHAFSYSRLGYGGSDPVSLPRKINHMHVEALSVLPQVLDAAGIKEHIIIGHSDGGSIGIIHAGSQKTDLRKKRKGVASSGPEHLKGLITLAAHLFCEPVTLEGIREAKQRYLSGHLRDKLARIHGPNTDNAFWGWNDIWLSPKFSQWNIERYLGPIRVPLFAIQGTQDPYGTMAQLDAIQAGNKAAKIFAVQGCGHFPHLEQRDRVTQRIISFIKQLL